MENSIDLGSALSEIDPLLKVPFGFADMRLTLINRSRHERLLKTKSLADQLLERQGQSEVYRTLVDGYVAKDIDPQGSLSDNLSIAYGNAYRAVFDLPMQMSMLGLWPIVFMDSCITPDSTFTFSEFAMHKVAQHPKILYTEALNPNEMIRYYTEADSIIAELRQKITELEGDGETTLLIGSAGLAIATIWSMIGILLTVKELGEIAAERAKIAIEQERKKKAAADLEDFERRMREIKPIQGSSDAIDRFERNREKYQGAA